MTTGKKRDGLTRRTFVWSAAAGALVAGSATALRPVYAGGARKLRYVTFVNKDSVWGKPYHFLAEEVEKQSGGELKIEYAGGSEVIGGFDAPEAIANGVFDISHSANSYFASAMPSSISLASGSASLDALQKAGVIAAYDEILGQTLGVKLLGIPMSNVGYVFMTRGRPDSLAYFKGKKIRSIPLYDPILQELGAATVTTSPAEAYTALERGVVDGLGWPDIGLFDYKFHENAKFVMAPSFYTLRTTTLMNKAAFDGLPKALQDVLVASAATADERGGEWCVETSANERAKMKSEGVEIVSLPDDEGAKFLAITEEKLWAKVNADSPTNGPRLQALFQKTA
jgi:TRAP-type C4-dicarboxylate transport system substrate-binding protein